jgi:hypothetical protein
MNDTPKAPSALQAPSAPVAQSTPQWIASLGNRLSAFKADPTEQNRLSLTQTMNGYREAILAGLPRPIVAPIEWKTAKTFSEWFRIQLDDALATFITNPCREDRFQALTKRLDDYREAVTMKRVKL